MEDKDPKDMLLADAIRAAIEAEKDKIILGRIVLFLIAFLLIDSVLLLMR